MAGAAEAMAEVAGDALAVRFEAYLAEHPGVGPDGAAERPLTRKQFGFAASWRGNHTEAAARAGYRGAPSTLSSLGARLFQDPRVQAVIERRRSRGELDGADPIADGATPVGQIPKGPSLPSGDTRAKYSAIADDPTIAMGHRMRALERLEQIERRERGTDDVEGYSARLRAAVAERLLEKRGREREQRRAGAEKAGS